MNLFEFLDNLIISLPRSENFKGFYFNKKTNKQHCFSTNIEDLFIFYPLESEIVSYIKTLNITFNLKTIHFRTHITIFRLLLFFLLLSVLSCFPSPVECP